ncbi:hypothetical protein LCGC14_1875680 [marine sediment metagenome]|uniref:Uncharacterized protein n=1 Tax=marine sediment metagenome TaxID=412755 RepID=A0A0F9GRV0_9ZZZZ
MKDNRPAFPFPAPVHDGVPGISYDDVQGISIRDYFAAKAMQGILGDGRTEGAIAANINSSLPVKVIPIQRATIAEVSYEYADAMLEAREQQ